LLVLSDVHLGSDLNDRLPPEAVVRRTRLVDADFIALLDHYRAEPRDGTPWRLVVAGDFIDFIGITIAPREGSVRTALSAEELENGLGNAEDHALEKLARVALRHGDIFDALARFVAAGHALSLVHGNHDVDFHWDSLKDEFRRLLVRHGKDQGLVAGAEAERAFGERVSFHPWFFYVSGVAYIEHGHQYDPFCSTANVMAPLSPVDPTRLARAASTSLVRWVVRPTRGMVEWGHEQLGMVDYIHFGLRLGLRGTWDLGRRFVAAVVDMVRTYRESVSQNAQTLRFEHERRMALLAEATRLGVDRLRALADLSSPPVTGSLFAILASVFLDRLALALFASLACIPVAVIEAGLGYRSCAALLVVLGWFTANRYLSRHRRIDYTDELQGRAGALAHLFPAAFVIMGHTHVPVRAAINDGSATYINVGAWAEEEPPADLPSQVVVPKAARTHAVVRAGAEGPVAELFEWQSGVGPRAFSRS
jgi:UDP-2,3-diacylglucosamine pyrophosphatase LpxH